MKLEVGVPLIMRIFFAYPADIQSNDTCWHQKVKCKEWVDCSYQLEADTMVLSALLRTVIILIYRLTNLLVGNKYMAKGGSG